MVTQIKAQNFLRDLFEKGKCKFHFFGCQKPRVLGSDSRFLFLLAALKTNWWANIFFNFDPFFLSTFFPQK